MTDEKLKQVRELQWEEGLAMIACTIFHGNCHYGAFLATDPDAKEKKYVDDWLTAQLALPKYKGKIIPGFNDGAPSNTRRKDTRPYCSGVTAPRPAKSANPCCVGENITQDRTTERKISAGDAILAPLWLIWQIIKMGVMAVCWVIIVGCVLTKNR